ncbi:MAG: thiamine-phosphate kinase [Gammaproteobacteria bacterium]|nr:thiamine-phosphate kinase [Gammaproteobacteria bacterium]
MDERTLISTFFDRRRGAGGPARGDVILGIGDDAAVLRLDPGYDLVAATDSIAEGTHFPVGTPAASVGHRCLAVNLSDMAAMAAEPLWFSLALSLPEADEAWVGEFARGLFALADRYAVELVGGDTVRGPLAATVTIQGRARPGCTIRRSGAAPGDGIWVTGNPGDAVAGRLLLPGPAADAAAETLRRRFLYPEPRVREGLALAGIASAMLDVSDGLDDDLRKLLAASRVGADMDAGALPLSAELRSVRAGGAVECALTGGDDYELCFTVRPPDEQRLRELAASWTVPVTRIGTVVTGSGCRWRLRGGALAVPDTTYRHF